MVVGLVLDLADSRSLPGAVRRKKNETCRRRFVLPAVSD